MFADARSHRYGSCSTRSSNRSGPCSRPGPQPFLRSRHTRLKPAFLSCSAPPLMATTIPCRSKDLWTQRWGGFEGWACAAGRRGEPTSCLGATVDPCPRRVGWPDIAASRRARSTTLDPRSERPGHRDRLHSSPPGARDGWAEYSGSMPPGWRMYRNVVIDRAPTVRVPMSSGAARAVGGRPTESQRWAPTTSGDHPLHGSWSAANLSRWSPTASRAGFAASRYRWAAGGDAD